MKITPLLALVLGYLTTPAYASSDILDTENGTFTVRDGHLTSYIGLDGTRIVRRGNVLTGTGNAEGTTFSVARCDSGNIKQATLKSEDGTSIHARGSCREGITKTTLHFDTAGFSPFSEFCATQEGQKTLNFKTPVSAGTINCKKGFVRLRYYNKSP